MARAGTVDRVSFTVMVDALLLIRPLMAEPLPSSGDVTVAGGQSVRSGDRFGRSSLPHGSGIPYGDSLRKLGLALKEVPRQDVIITGRLCCHSSSAWGGYGAGAPEFSAERVVRDVEDQLALLGTDYFDGMLIHDPPRMQPTLAEGGTLAGLLGLKARGLVRNVGYGMRPHEFHRQAIATGDVDFLLCFNDYHLVRQTAAQGVLPAADAAGVGVMNGWSILRGLLTGVDIDEAIKLGGYKNEADRAGPRALAVPRPRSRSAATRPAVLPARAASTATRSAASTVAARRTTFPVAPSLVRPDSSSIMA